MTRYLVSGKYTPQTTAVLREVGYASRVDALRDALASVGGTLEHFWFTIGEWSFHLIVDVPSDAVNFAIDSMAWSPGAAERFAYQPLYTAEEADAAIAITVDYSPPAG
jgi:uncharacterized protein with GYD domain